MNIQQSIYIWPDGYGAGDIAEFSISSGDLPIREYHVRNGEITGRNRVNGSRDGGQYFPPGFFNGKTVPLTENLASDIRGTLAGIDFCTWVTDISVFEQFRSEGFCVTESFSCDFRDGKKFRYIGQRGKTPDEFEELFRLLESKCAVPSWVSGESPERKRYKVLCPACARAIRPDSAFCSGCGEELASCSNFVFTMIEVNLDETVRLCGNCSNDIAFGDRYCRHCGAPVR